MPLGSFKPKVRTKQCAVELEKNILFEGTVSRHCVCAKLWCREIKRCEESKRTLKNPLASRLAEFNSTLKLLRITDPWCFTPVKFWFGRNRDFWRYFYCRWPEDQNMWSALITLWSLWCDGRLISSASFIQAQLIVKGKRRNETATIKTVSKKPLRHWCDWGDLVDLSFVK